MSTDSTIRLTSAAETAAELGLKHEQPTEAEARAILDQDEPSLADLLRVKLAFDWEHPLYKEAVQKLTDNPEHQGKVKARERAAAVEAEAEKLRIRDEAKLLVYGSTSEPLPDSMSLEDLAAAPDPDYFVEELWPEDGKVILAGPAKAGKSTIVTSLVASLTSGDRFLDRFDVDPITERVFILDTELSPSQMKGYYRSLLGTGADVQFLSLRGRMGAANLLDPEALEALAERIRGAGTLIVDPLGPLLAASGVDENENTGVRKVLMALDELCRKAGVRRLLLVHHHGHSNGRERGASVLKDWSDARWTLTMEDPDDHGSTRYFGAVGRDVDVAARVLERNGSRLSLSTTTKAAAKGRAKNEELDAAILAFARDNPGASKRQVATGVNGRAGTVNERIAALEKQGALVVTVHGQTHSVSLPQAVDEAAVLNDEGTQP